MTDRLDFCDETNFSVRLARNRFQFGKTPTWRVLLGRYCAPVWVECISRHCREYDIAKAVYGNNGRGGAPIGAGGVMTPHFSRQRGTGDIIWE